MYIPYVPATTTHTPQAAAWALILDRLCATIAYTVPQLAALVPLLTAARRRIHRTLLRLDRLILRWQTNTLPRPRPSRAGRPRTPPPEPKPDTRPRKPLPRLPTGQAWLSRRVRFTNVYGGQIAVELAKPETRAFVEAAPQAGRLLRPLCRALGVPLPDWLKLPERPKPDPNRSPHRDAGTPRTPKPRQPKLPPGYLPGMLPTDRPLPKRIIDAVRSHKKRGLWTPA